MELVPTIFSTGWASGVNAYATVLLLGLLGRAGVGDVPEELTKDPIIIAAAIMYVIEFVADKVPYVDTTWDVAHTAIRPAIGSAIGIEFADLDSASAAFGGVAGGLAALASHSTKAGLRLAINTSPEPFTNFVASVSEDFAAAGVTILALYHPKAAATIALILLIAGAVLLYFVWKLVRIAWRRWKRHRAEQHAARHHGRR